MGLAINPLSRPTGTLSHEGRGKPEPAFCPPPPPCGEGKGKSEYTN